MIKKEVKTDSKKFICICHLSLKIAILVLLEIVTNKSVYFIGLDGIQSQAPMLAFLAII